MAEEKSWSGGVGHSPAAPKATRKQEKLPPHPVPPCAYKGCNFCHGGPHTHDDAEEPHPCEYPAQSAITAYELLQHFKMVPRLVPSCSTARVHRFFADWNILDPDFKSSATQRGGRKTTTFFADSLGDLAKLHAVEGYHLLPRRIFASYSAHNMQRAFAVNLETPRPGTASGQSSLFRKWAATNCCVGRQTNASLGNVGLVVRDGTVQNELVYEMRLPPCEGDVHPPLALAALDLNETERRINGETTSLSLATNEKQDAIIIPRPHEAVMAAAGDVSEPLIPITSERRQRALEHVYTLRELAQKSEYLMSMGEGDSTGSRPKITMYPIGEISNAPVGLPDDRDKLGEFDKLVTEATRTLCAAMRFSVEFTVVYNVIPSVH